MGKKKVIVPDDGPRPVSKTFRFSADENGALGKLSERTGLREADVIRWLLDSAWKRVSKNPETKVHPVIAITEMCGPAGDK
jgi:hypothetical protein